MHALTHTRAHSRTHTHMLCLLWFNFCFAAFSDTGNAHCIRSLLLRVVGGGGGRRRTQRFCVARPCHCDAYRRPWLRRTHAHPNAPAYTRADAFADVFTDVKDQSNMVCSLAAHPSRRISTQWQQQWCRWQRCCPLCAVCRRHVHCPSRQPAFASLATIARNCFAWTVFISLVIV